MDNRGAEKFLSVYWFLILFLVTGAVVYMAFLFYGSPYNIRNPEGQILGDRIADCLMSKGYLNNAVSSPEFKNNFLEACNINLDTEDFSDWKSNEQYYIGLEIYEFNENAPVLTGNPVLNLSAGDINLKTAWESTILKGTGSILQPGGRKIDRIVIHYTATYTAQQAIDIFNLGVKDRKKSIHYVVDKDGTVYSYYNLNHATNPGFIPESQVAWHAGCEPTRPLCHDPTNNEKADPQDYPTTDSDCCVRGINERSIGIEVVNLGWLCGASGFEDICQNAGDGISADGSVWEKYPDAQVTSLIDLVSDLAARYEIPLDRNHIIGHSEVESGGKVDPGPAFPWDEFMERLNSQKEFSPVSFASGVGQQERSFYALDQSGNQYIVRILTLVGKIGKNER